MSRTTWYVLSFAVALLVVPLMPSGPAQAVVAVGEASCPAPSVPRGGICELTSDVVIDTTLQLPSFTRLNCKGFTISPASVSTPSTPSIPEVAILLEDVRGVKMQNCVLEEFDFGVFVLDAKVSPSLPLGERARLRNRILSNTIRARYTAITVVSADDNLVAENEIRFPSGQGFGISLARDSDRNIVSENRVEGASTGILLSGGALEDAVVKRNTVENTTVPLFLDQAGARFFGASVLLNDFVSTAERNWVAVGDDFDLMVELSVGGRGNYWGRTCEEGGFIPGIDSPSRFVTDSHPYGVRVARTSDESLPAPCR